MLRFNDLVNLARKRNIAGVTAVYNETYNQSNLEESVSKQHDQTGVIGNAYTNRMPHIDRDEFKTRRT